MHLRSVGLTACAGIAFGACTFPRPPDVGGDEDAAVDARPDVVMGTWRLGHRTPAGLTMVPVDLSRAVIQALIPDATQPTGFRVIDGAGGADGTFMIEGVPPETEYYLKVAAGSLAKYWVTTHHAPSLYAEYRSRAGVLGATLPTPVTLDVDNVVPFVAAAGGVYDLLFASSNTADVAVFFLAGPGDTHVVAELDWRDVTTGFDPPMPDTSLGDDFYFVQARARPTLTLFGRRQILSTLLAAAPADIVVRNGAPATSIATLVHLTDDRQLRVAMSRSDFDVAYDHTSSLGEFSTNVYAFPTAGAPTGNEPPLLYLRVADWSRDPSVTYSSTVGYADPFPASWKRLVVQSYGRRRWLLAPGATEPVGLPAEITHARELTSDEARFRVAVAPPAGVRIDGFDANAGGAISLAPMRPIALSWLGSALATQYRVSVFRLSAAGGFTRARMVATLSTTTAAVLVPTEILSGGEQFAFVVAAVASANDYGNGVLEVTGTPVSEAQTPTGGFRFSATCGNRVIDAGEACDEGQPSATCDADCTAVVCGDGLRNVLAGEICDTIRDTLGCDSDCTSPVCGDGHRNVDLEDCDDGNVVDDGNGCGPNCKFDNSCPNGILEPIVEMCDDGPGSPTCDDDCTEVVCGDAVVNPAAGEQCDDGNDDSSDGCSSSCQLE